MHYIANGPDSFVNLPREGGVAYAAQESWVQNETIKVRLHILYSRPELHVLAGQHSLRGALRRGTVHQGYVLTYLDVCASSLTEGTVMIVLEQCALLRDLSLFEAGDQTEVGEKGITLRYVTSALGSDYLLIFHV